MHAKHLRECLQEHRDQESAAAEVEDEGVMLELRGRERGTEDSREEG